MAERSAEDQTVELPLGSVARVPRRKSGRILLLTNEVLETGAGGIPPASLSSAVIGRAASVDELAANASRRNTKIR